MKKIIFPLLILIGILNTSCSDFLDLENPNEVTSQTFWKTQEDLTSAVATVYNAFTEEPAGYWEIQAQQMKACRTENFVTRNDVIGRYSISTFKNTPSTDVSRKIFKSLYVGIFRANQVLEEGAKMEGIDESIKNQLLSETYFLRGLNYFNVAIEFGDAPLITTLAEGQEDFFTAKSPVSDIWNQVISDLQKAKEYLPIKYSTEQTGRATKGAAIAYLGKAYLYLEQWDKAETEFSELVNNESTYGYGLVDNYAELFDGKHENSKESVFEIQFSLEGGPDIWTSNLMSRTRATTMAQECAPGEVGGWFELMPTKTLLNAFLEEKTTDNSYDPRALATLAWDYPGCIYYTHNFTETFEKDAIWLRKFQNWWNADEGEWKSTLNEYPMRYADVLLMLAEAYTQQGKISQAAPLVQRIRTRANLKNLSSEMATWNQDQMMKEIMHQRNIEFAREGTHFYDLRRWGTLENVIKASKEDGYQNYTPRNEYYPIPEDELNNNPLITQNSAW